MYSIPAGSPRSPPLLAVLVLAGASLLAACTPSREVPVAADTRGSVADDRPTMPPPSKQQAAARMQECRGALEAALQTGLVSNASVDNGRPILWVGPAWRSSNPAVKDAVVRHAACFFLSGDESRMIQFSVYEQATDTELAVWNRTHLVFP